MDTLRRCRLGALYLVMALFTATVGPLQAQEEQPVVHAVLFYSPACPHCEEFILNELPGLYELYDGQLKVIGVNTMESEGWAIYQEAAEHFSIPNERRGVPTLIVRDAVLVGGVEITEQLPSIIDAGLAASGIPLPDLPLLQAALQQAEAESTKSEVPTETSVRASEESTQSDTTAQMSRPASEQSAQSDVTVDALQPISLSPMELFALDPAGNTLSVVVLLAMMAALAYVLILAWQAFTQGNVQPLQSEREWLVPALGVAGLAVASYLAYVETQNVEAVCGPVGDCNTVQQSSYARVFGVLPVGVLGAVGYVVILALWAWRHLTHSNGRAALAELTLLGVLTGATLFSAYLTFLEPFVIGATCAWCLTSAVIITALLLITARPGIRAGQEILQRAAS